MNKSKIDWTDYTFNAITGCRHDCPYCYARTMSRRFSGDIRLNKASDQYQYDKERDLYILDKPFISREGRALNYPFGFEPTLHQYRLDMPQKLKMASNVFVGSMADVFGDWVPDAWIEMIFKACDEAPQHNYLFLTKNPKRYKEIQYKIPLPASDNYWYGTTVNNSADFIPPCRAEQLAELKGHKKFLSIEPILGEIHGIALRNLRCFQWIIVGAETGNRKDKVIPNKEWILAIKKQCRDAGIPLFMKESLKELVGQDFIQEFPEGLKPSNEIPKNIALHNKLISNCGICKEENLKSNMIALLVRGKRGTSAKQLTHICKCCLEDWCNSLGITIPELEVEEWN
ncbi:DUF5131 family protein [uncultured Tissierella sp.]|uniref:DUF5131 family protein n=1 Tax=uncultured Tissierella sp. TaxID=448160 RepID=UPI0028051426|nr:DUF5131 family protein [uncultured Tissierella sp.]MDU5080261.1 DUF5131 family protein [Bacillota bacterium]